MKRNKKDDIVLLKFKLIYQKVFLNPKFVSAIKTHFNKNGGFAAFILGFVENQIGREKLLKHIDINLPEWIELFADLYDDLTIIDTYSNLGFNPIISLEEIKKSFSCFDKMIDKIWMYFNSEQLSININEFHTKQILKSSLGYLLYNSIDCRIKYDFLDILSDPLYDQKIVMITYNTKLFADAKRCIVNNCGKKINDLITLLLGASKDLNFDK